MSRLSHLVRRARIRAPRRLLAAVAVAFVVLVIGAGPASAHAVLVSADPGFASVVTDAPKVLRLGFSESVDPTADSFTLRGPDGRPLRLTGVTRDPTAESTLVVGLPPGLGPGTYAVQWHVIGRDGHPTFGEFKFAVRAPSSSLASSSGQSGAGPSLLGGAGRALSAGGGLALVGLAVFPLLVLRPARRRLDASVDASVGEAVETEASRRLRLPAYAAAAVAAVGTLLVLADTVSGGRSALTTLSHPGRVLDLATATRTGTLLLVRLVAIAAAITMLAVLQRRAPYRSRRALSVGAALSVLVLVFTFSLSSHAEAEADRVVAIPMDVMHLLAAGVWAGGLLGLALAALPAARALPRGSGDDAAADAAGAFANRFSILAQGAMLALLATGAYASLMRITSFGDIGSVWGRDLVVKLSLFVTLLVVASGSALRVVPVLADRAQARVARRAAAGQLASSVRLELGLAAALVVTAGILSATAPPDQSQRLTTASAAPTITRATGAAAGYDVDVQAVTTGTGRGAATVFGVNLTTQGTAASAPGASGVLVGADGVAHGFGLRLVDQGQWTSQQLAVRPGRYQMTVQIDRTNGAARIPVAVRVG